MMFAFISSYGPFIDKEMFSIVTILNLIESSTTLPPEIFNR